MGVTVEDKLIVTSVLVHVIEFVTGFTVTAGAPDTGNTCMVEEATHPLIGSVAVKVYNPGAQADVEKLVVDPHTNGPDQFAVALVGDETLPFNETEAELQVRV
jgi:hypothetical protein